MFATLDVNDSRVIHIGKGFETVQSGYRVNLHDLPAYTFLVDAPTADSAQRMAFSVAKQEGRARSDAATIQKF